MPTSGVGAALRHCADSGELDLPLPGAGETVARLDALVRLGRRDPVLARLGEGHADALAIMAELGADPPPARSVWGVWAAVPKSLTATHTAAGWEVTGSRPWCSGAGLLTHALVTAQADDGPRLFAVEVRAPAAVPVDGTWPAVGMAASDSRTVRFTATRAVPVGRPNDYVNRPGFWHGSIGVAACWYGGALGVADTLRRAVADGRADPHTLAHFGAVDASHAAAASLLRHAAHAIDARPEEHQPRLARQVRATVESSAVDTIDRVGRALGAAPLCLDETHARRVADLTVYLRQSHAEHDLEELGRLASEAAPPW